MHQRRWIPASARMTGQKNTAHAVHIANTHHALPFRRHTGGVSVDADALRAAGVGATVIVFSNSGMSLEEADLRVAHGVDGWLGS
jgi:hypothetical protein